ncbi:uncharacterized protein [Nicotiana sylvestris]|uniref:uncharacterized protein n=1 Tax=Nicotiana sylvestris TaxID=4096 RepID=UPI00388C9563
MTFTYPYGTFDFKRMSFGLCNAPASFYRCMMATFTDMMKKFVEVFMDDFSVFGLLEKDVTCKFDEACLKAFEELKLKLVATPIIVAPDWSLPFDANDHAIGPEFDVEIRDRKGTENQVIDQLSRLENHVRVEKYGQIKETFPDEQLFAITHDPAP